MQRILVLGEGGLQCRLNFSRFISLAFKLRENASVLGRVVTKSLNHQVARLAFISLTAPDSVTGGEGGQCCSVS